MKYNADYFIKKFESIPESKWAIGSFKRKYGQCCALGHCGQTNFAASEEANALSSLFYMYLNTNPVMINDAVGHLRDDAGKELMRVDEFGTTPKERILVALECIKGIEL